MAETQRNLEHMFPVTIQQSRIADAPSLNMELIRAVYELKKKQPNTRPTGWTFNVYTTIEAQVQLHEMPQFQNLVRHIMAEANSFGRALSLDVDNYPLRLIDCWVNIYAAGDGQEVHHHSNSIVSGSYYVKMPQGASGLLFHSPMADDMLLPPYSQTTPLNSLAREVKVQAGDMVLFRSWLKHSVRPSAVKDERISISFNLSM